MSGAFLSTFRMLLAAAFGTVIALPTTVLLMAFGLVAVLFANTYLLLLNNPAFKWQYGLFRFIAYFGMAILSFSTGGIMTVIPVLSSFLGMELQRLMTQLDLQVNFIRGMVAHLTSSAKKKRA